MLTIHPTGKCPPSGALFFLAVAISIVGATADIDMVAIHIAGI